MNSRPFILALLVINVLVNWACTFSPQPKSGLQSCDPSDRSCPFGYVCAADNKCWRSEDLVNAADASGVTNASGAAGGGGRGSGGANQGASSAIGNGGAVAPSGGAGGRGGSSGSAGASGSCTQPTAAETGRASMCLNGLAVHLVCAGTIPGTTRPPCCGLEYPYYCPQTDLCYTTPEAAAAACGGSGCSVCVNAYGGCTNLCSVFQVLDKTTCTCSCGTTTCLPGHYLNTSTCTCS